MNFVTRNQRLALRASAAFLVAFLLAPALAQTLLIEAAGLVEFSRAGNTNWSAAARNTPLAPGDRVRTGPASRAAIQFSDRSLIRLNERTTLLIQAPRGQEKRRFFLPSGSIFFFNREDPRDVEFETPLASGAIRGTEFLLDSGEDQTRLALLDGIVEIAGGGQTNALATGEEIFFRKNGRPRVQPIVSAGAAIQWALYYPMVIDPADLGLADSQARALAPALRAYRQGDPIAALKELSNEPSSSPARYFHAALLLSVGAVDAAETILNTLPGSPPAAKAMREMIAIARGEQSSLPAAEATSVSEWMAISYRRQAISDLESALAAARKAVALAPEFGPANARLAELEFAFDNHGAALRSLEEALRIAPRNPQAHALRGFVLLERNQPGASLASFERALDVDAGFGLAWLGKGLAQGRLGQLEAARLALQAAAALEPRRSLFRSYLAKAFSAEGRSTLADKDFRLAKEFDPEDPTAWLYSGLHRWLENRPNEAVRDLERSIELNDNRSVFRSSLLLDRDRAVRSANLAAIYEDAGLSEVGKRAAAKSVSESHLNFSGHLFLANALRQSEDPYRYNLRYESARNSELLMANLLAPSGGGNLSQVLSQQDHLRYFDPRPFNLSSFTEYQSAGDWRQTSSAFGTLSGFSYALDSIYRSQNGQRAFENLESTYVSGQFKQDLGYHDSVYLQLGWQTAKGGDLANYFDPSQARAGVEFHEDQFPNAHVGWTHRWSPGAATLLLLSHLEDDLSFTDPGRETLFVRKSRGLVTSVRPQPFQLSFGSRFHVNSGELQQIWESSRNTFIAGFRLQEGAVESAASLRPLLGTSLSSAVESNFGRAAFYLYDSFRAADWLRLTTGASYDRLELPSNADFPPLLDGSFTTRQFSPKAGLFLTPWTNGLLRATYARSIGGLYFDNSVRLEPTQIAGFNQTFRSMAPESVAGLTPGASFENAGLAFDQSFSSATYLGAAIEWLSSDVGRAVGVLTNRTLLPFPNAPSHLRQELDFSERRISAYVAQLFGSFVSMAARYSITAAELRTRFPALPASIPGAAALNTDGSSTLHALSFDLHASHPTGIFAQWESAWYQQDNHRALPDEDFWQHSLLLGYRLPRRRAEIRAGVLNITDQAYRLNPLTTVERLPRERTFYTSLRLNF